MSAKLSRLIILFFAVCLLLPSQAQAQGIGGAISGVVRDQQGLAVPGAPVRIQNTATGQIRNVSSDNEGHYEARELPPGTYDVTVEQSGFKTVIIKEVQLSVGQNARLQGIVLEPIPVEEKVEVTATAEVAMVDATTPTLSTSFGQRQIRELPILTRDLNNLALLAPGVFSVRTFSFASTLVPFAANGSRGRDNNFIIDSVDNNEPLFGGAATQFTNSDLFAEYRVLTNQYKAEYGRNSGSVVNIITERGGNRWKGTAFWFGQTDQLNASNEVERIAGLRGPTRYYENIAGVTLGGPLKKENSWIFASYQWDRARNDLSPVYPLVANLPTPAGLSALSAFAGLPGVNPGLNTLVSTTSVRDIPLAGSPCGQSGSGLPAVNPCTIGTLNLFPAGVFNPFPVVFPAAGVPINYGAYLVQRAGIFDVRDHQGSFRFDQRLTQRDDIYARYLFDDLRTPRTTGFTQAEAAFSDFGLLPDYRTIFKQRTQNLGLFWTHAWPTALHELRVSGTRISSQTGAFNINEQARETVPAMSVFDAFAFNVNAAGGGTPAGTASFLNSFVSSGAVFTLGRDARPSKVNSNLFQLQDNMSISRGKHSIKFGANFVRTQSNIRQTPSDLGQYFYLRDPFNTGFENFLMNFAVLALQRFPNFGGIGGDVLPLREFSHFYFFQDDFQWKPSFTINYGIRYENFGQAINTIANLNFNFGQKIKTDRNNFAPRIGFAWSPDTKTVVRGGYGLFYNPTVLNIALLVWQSGRISPFIANFPSNTFPSKPFNASDLLQSFTDCSPFGFFAPTGPTWVDCSAEDGVNRNLRNPYVQNWSVSVQRQFGKDFLFEVVYVGSKGTSLFQRLDRNPRLGWSVQLVPGPTCGLPPCISQNGRLDVNRGPITEVANTAFSTYNALQVSGTKRLTRAGWFSGLALTAAYTWSHMIDNASEIFGPGVRYLPGGVSQIVNRGAATTVEVITPFAQTYNNTSSAERGNSSFDRRHRVAISYLWALPSPAEGSAKHLLGGWQLSGFVSAQTGQPFTPINGFSGPCRDANGDGVLTNDRPTIGDPQNPLNTVALLRDTNCVNTALGYVTPAGLPTSPAANHFVQVPRGFSAGQTFTVAGQSFVAGNVGRNTLTGPGYVNVDLAVFKNIYWGERRTFQLRFEAYNLLNTRNPGSPTGNVYTTDAQPVPAIAFSPSASPARVTGVIPENTLDATDPVTGSGEFLSQRFMNTSSRRIQLGLKLLF